MMAPRMCLPAAPQGGGEVDFVTIVDEAIVLLRQQGRLTYRTLQFPLQPLWVHPSLHGHGYGSRRLRPWNRQRGRSSATGLSSTRTVPVSACSH